MAATPDRPTSNAGQDTNPRDEGPIEHRTRLGLARIREFLHNGLDTGRLDSIEGLGEALVAIATITDTLIDHAAAIDRLQTGAGPA